jgi:Holliday junction DNA helicase RuvA
MIARIEGTLREKTPTCLVVDTHGVGYEIFVPLSTFLQLPDEGATVVLRIHTHVREDAIQLFGFATVRERALFELLLRTNGIGPKLAQGILSGIEPGALVEALAEGDVVSLRRIPGLGQKKAERLVVELRERAGELRVTLGGVSPKARSASDGAAGSESAAVQALSALVNLGYAVPEAKRVIDEAQREAGDDASVAVLLRGALRRLSRRDGGRE